MLNLKCLSVGFKVTVVLPLLLQTRCLCWGKREQISALTRIRSGTPSDNWLLLFFFFWLGLWALTSAVLQNANEAVWYDVGVFKTLYSEVSHYFLRADSDQTSAVTSGRPSNMKEVKYSHICSGIMVITFILTCVMALLCCRGGCLDHMTTGAETSRSCFQVRLTGSGSQASTALVKETLALSASSRPASLVFLERPLLLKSQRCSLCPRSLLNFDGFNATLNVWLLQQILVITCFWPGKMASWC